MSQCPHFSKPCDCLHCRHGEYDPEMHEGWCTLDYEEEESLFIPQIEEEEE